MAVQNQQELATDIPSKLFGALNKIDRPGSFATSGSLSAVLPGLEIIGVGPIAFPLTEHQAKQIKQQCTQAPYGKGEATLVDTTVRRVWQMMPDQFQLTNPKWQEFLAQTLKTVEQDLGLGEQKLESHLYNLLLYDQDSFFLPHRDGEKIDRMVATLVVVLPSAYEGGELVIHHEGQEQTIDFSYLPNNSFDTHFAAFYADCEHEVKPLRNGYRLCLIYNLALEKFDKSIYAPRSKGHIEGVTNILHQWTLEPGTDAPDKLAIILDHQYSQDGVAWDALKGMDRAKAQIIREAASRAGCKMHLALLTLWQTGSAMYCDDGDSYNHRYRHYDNSPPSYEMEEICDSSLTAEHWLDDEGHQLGKGSLMLLEEDVVPEGSLTDVDPEEDFEEFTGNAGMELTRWYRHAAIFLWPEKHHFRLLCECGSEVAISALNLLVHKWQDASSTEKASLRAKCIELTSETMAQWDPRNYYNKDAPLKTCDLIPTLELLDSQELIKAFFVQVMARDVSVHANTLLLSACERHGWTNFEKEFVNIFESASVESIPRNIHLLTQLYSEELERTQEWLKICQVLSQVALSNLKAIDADKENRHSKLDRSSILADLVRFLTIAQQFDALTELVVYTLGNPPIYSLTPVLVLTLINLKDWLLNHVTQDSVDPLLRWVTDCSIHLQSLTAQIPQEFTDFCRPVEISCKCPDCQDLISFLQNPLEKQYRFRIREDRRRHLQDIIAKHQCDVDHTTEMIGSPYTLVCTKNSASFHRRLKKYHEDSKHLVALRSIKNGLTA